MRSTRKWRHKAEETGARRSGLGILSTTARAWLLPRVAWAEVMRGTTKRKLTHWSLDDERNSTHWREDIRDARTRDHHNEEETGAGRVGWGYFNCRQWLGWSSPRGNEGHDEESTPKRIQGQDEVAGISTHTLRLSAPPEGNSMWRERGEGQEKRKRNNKG